MKIETELPCGVRQNAQSVTLLLFGPIMSSEIALNCRFKMGFFLNYIYLSELFYIACIAVFFTPPIDMTLHVHFIHNNGNFQQSFGRWCDVSSRGVLCKFLQVATVIINNISYKVYVRQFKFVEKSVTRQVPWYNRFSSGNPGGNQQHLLNSLNILSLRLRRSCKTAYTCILDSEQKSSAHLTITPQGDIMQSIPTR